MKNYPQCMVSINILSLSIAYLKVTFIGTAYIWQPYLEAHWCKRRPWYPA